MNNFEKNKELMEKHPAEGAPLSISIHDVKPRPSDIKMAKKIVKLLKDKKFKTAADAFSDLTKTRMKTGELSIKVKNALRAMGVEWD